MKVTKFNRLSELIAKNTLVYVLGEHGTVVVGVGGSLGVVLYSEELAGQIHVPGGSTAIANVEAEGNRTARRVDCEKGSRRWSDNGSGPEHGVRRE